MAISPSTLHRRLTGIDCFTQPYFPFSLKHYEVPARLVYWNGGKGIDDGLYRSLANASEYR
jgi:hypothetical protein